MKSLHTVQDWLAYFATVHPAEIALGLERVQQVALRLQVLQPDCPVIMVGGTNGKGSCVAGLEAIYQQAGFKVAAFTSPYLVRINEEFRVNRVQVTDAALCAVFEKVEAARDGVALTVFEYKTLAALVYFQAAKPDVMILEVGLGGRLDAVNIVDADVAVVASVAIDHADRLGATRELIGYEKAGIFRRGKPAVCGDPEPPVTLLDYAESNNVPLRCAGKDFHYRRTDSMWEWQSGSTQYSPLPLPKLLLQNMATVLMTVTVLQDRLPVTTLIIQQACANVALTGRIQVHPGAVTRIVDVSHNPAAATELAAALASMPTSGRTLAVFSMLADKDIANTIAAMKNTVDAWYVAPLPTPRGVTRQELTSALVNTTEKPVYSHETIAAAYQAAMATATPGDRVVIFGSFHTVAAVINALC